MSAAIGVSRPPILAWPRRKGQKRPSAAGLRALVYGNRLYALTLLGKTPQGLALHPPDLWPGNAAVGDHLFQGRYRFMGQEVASPAGPVWLPPGIANSWLEEMHGFSWLRHFKASDGEAARRHARAVVADWISRCGRWSPVVWDAAVCGRRLVSWLTAAGFLINGAAPGWRADFFASLAMQARHLARCARAETAGDRRFAALCGMLYAAVCLDGNEKRNARAARALERECLAQIPADGGHTSRSPARHCRVLADLVDCRELLHAANREPPDALLAAIEGMAPVLRALCHGDGGLAVFNDSAETTFPDPASVLKAAGSSVKPLANARQAGFQRLAAGRTLLIIDAGRSAGGAIDHAGATAFEMSVGGNRLIVNCGPHTGRGSGWTQALRSTAAHSTLALADTSAEAGADVDCERHSDGGAVWFGMEHAGYARRFGFMHRRRFYAAADGADVRGEDALLPADGGAPGPQPYTIRFHLHPTVKASLTQHGEAVLLLLPGGGAWRLHCSGGSLAINPSVYFAADEECRPCQQVVIVGVCGADGMATSWALRRLSAGQPA